MGNEVETKPHWKQLKKIKIRKTKLKETTANWERYIIVRKTVFFEEAVCLIHQKNKKTKLAWKTSGLGHFIVTSERPWSF